MENQWAIFFFLFPFLLSPILAFFCVEHFIIASASGGVKVSKKRKGGWGMGESHESQDEIGRSVCGKSWGEKELSEQNNWRASSNAPVTGMLDEASDMAGLAPQSTTVRVCTLANC